MTVLIVAHTETDTFLELLLPLQLAGFVHYTVVAHDTNPGVCFRGHMVLDTGIC